MMNRLNTTHREAGGILLTMMAFVFIVTVLLGGVATFVVGHDRKVARDMDYNTAIYLAEAGINYELRTISTNPRSQTIANQHYPATGQPGPYTGSITGVTGGSFTVYVEPADGSVAAWYSPRPMRIVSTGTCNGMSRTSIVQAKRKSVFDEFVFFPLIQGTVGGNGSQIIGAAGTDGPITVNSGAGAASFVGTLTFCGLTPTLTGTNIYWEPDPRIFPTVADFANFAFPAGGLTWLATNNTNDRFSQFNSNRVVDPDYLLANKISAGITKNDYVLNSSTFSGAKKLTIDGNINDAAGGNRYATAIEGLYNQRTLIIPPGDYYLTSADVQIGSGAILVDNAAGRVRIWFTGNSGGKDNLSAIFIFTGTVNPSNFRLFYNKSAELDILGNSTFYGGFYAEAAPNTATIKMGGGSQIVGAIIGQSINIGGNTIIRAGTVPNDDADDLALWFGFSDAASEMM